MIVFAKNSCDADFIGAIRTAGVDGKHVASLGSASGWDAAAACIEKHTAYRTPLRRLAELGERHQPEQAAAMLADLLKHRTPRADIAHTLRNLSSLSDRWDHILITDGVIDNRDDHTTVCT